MASNVYVGYELLTLVGGPANGKTCSIARLVKAIRIAVHSNPTSIVVDPIKNQTVPEVAVETYIKREFRDQNGVRKTFLVHENLPDNQAEVELYLLGLIDTEGNFE